MNAPTLECTACHKPVPEGAAFCPTCGSAQSHDTSGPTAFVAGVNSAERAEYKARLQRALGAGYELRGLIGSGGFADVYVAWDVKLNREVAIKALRPDIVPTATMLERFRREAAAVAKLRHPNIIPIFAVGEGEGEGVVYFVMPLVKGESLAATLQRERQLPVAEVRRILVEAANALSEAHEAGLIHRDIKPENIMLEGKRRRVLLMDFGIAKAVDNAEGGGLTMTGMLIGTPSYMSPEQASGERSIDARSDQYSLATVGYRMLTGDLPFDAKTPAQLAYRKAAEAPRPAHVLSPETPLDLSDALARAMANDPAERFPDMDAFAVAVGAGAPSVTAPAAVSADSLELELERKAASSRPIGAALLVAGFLGVAALAGLYRTIHPPPVTAPRETRQQALAKGREFLQSMGASGSFTEAVEYDAEPQAWVFVQQSLGTAEARRRIGEGRTGNGVGIGAWRLRWFVPGQLEDWKVSIDRGEVVGFDHTLEESAPGADLTLADARAVAESFITARGWSLDALKNIEASSLKFAKRTDHVFQWEKIGSTVTWRDGSASASTRVIVVVKGGNVGRYLAHFRLPQEFVREEAKPTIGSTVMIVLVVLGGLLALGYTIARARLRDVRWRPAIWVAVVAGVAMAVYLLIVTSSSTSLYSYSGQSSLVRFWAGNLLMAVFLGAFGGGLILLGAAAGESLARAHLPETLGGYYAVLRGRLSSTALAHDVIRGYAFGALLLGSSAAFSAFANAAPGWRTVDLDFNEARTSMLPIIHPLVGSLSGALGFGTIVLFGLSLLTRWLKLVPVAMIAAVLLALSSPSNQPYGLGAVEAALAVGLCVLAFLRAGFIGCIVAFYLSMMVPVGLELLEARDPEIVVAGVVTLLLALVPATIPIVWWKTGRSRDAAAPRLEPAT